ncbi:muts domain V-domain-containing protein [Gautieria morchelliformis]|nr:muts domain V-domain-containing protein [Gautieria morchelliformis]
MPSTKKPSRKRKKPLQVSQALKTTSLDCEVSTEQETPLEGSDEEQESGRKKRVRWGSEVDESKSSRIDDEDGCSDGLEQICLSVSCHHGRLGAAYYDPLKATLYILEDTTDSAHYDLTRLLLEQASPEIVITGSRSDDKFIEVVRAMTDSTSTTFQIRPNREFNHTKGYERLLALRLFASLPNIPPSAVSDTEPSSTGSATEDPKNAYDFMRKRHAETGDPSLQRWTAAIRLSNFSAVEASPFCISATGALLDYLARARAVGELEDEGIGGLEIRSIEFLALDQTMHINADALSSLQIFDDENHASIHSDKTKEGLSLFGILDATRTSLGRRLLRNWFLRPSLSLSTIASRHNALSCFLRSENLVTSSAMHSHLKGIGNAPHVFGILRGGRAGVREWQTVVKFVFHICLLREAISELNQGTHVDVIKKLIGVIDIASFREMGNAVNETIDWEESSNAARVCVRPHVDKELDEWKRIFHGLDSVLSRVAAQLGGTVPPNYAESLNVVYFPQLGFLICVPLREEWKNEDGTHVPEPPNDEFIFQVRYKAISLYAQLIQPVSSFVQRRALTSNRQKCKHKDLDHHIGDLYPAIVDREIEIIQALEERVLMNDEVVLATCDACAELDCLLSLAEASRAYGYVQPHMVDESLIDIKGGRHPLQERVVDTFVPNDTFMIGGAGIGVSVQDNVDTEDGTETSEHSPARSVIVCTGANACGKSVYLKQTALIVYMAQIGCFVPAESATLGIVDKIFTRVQTRESVSKVQSAFMIDLNQVSLALRNMTPRSLLIIDEFGKGTVSSDGAGLFCGLLKFALSLGTCCPKVLAATHFHDVFHNNLLPPSLPISFLHMQILLTSSSGVILDKPDTGNSENDEGRRLIQPGESITYLYRVAQGLCLDSYASKCALAFGIAPRVVQRAEHISDLLSAHAVGELLDEGMTTEEQRDLADAEGVCRRFLALDLRTYREGEDRDDVKALLRQTLGRNGDQDGEGGNETTDHRDGRSFFT